jgi:hypothetical protein
MKKYHQLTESQQSKAFNEFMRDIIKDWDMGILYPDIKEHMLQHIAQYRAENAWYWENKDMAMIEPEDN